MDLSDVKRINSLWQKLYPYLALQILEAYRRDSGAVLELGPFSGGISMQLARSCPRLSIIIADESAAMVEHFRKVVSDCELEERIEVKETDLNHLIFADSQFDLVIFRGAFFFLSDRGDILQEVFRVLRNRGMAFIGGGYGKGVPAELIGEIADETRELNRKLGRRWLGIPELENIIKRSGLADKCRVQEEGGVWLVIKK